MLIYQIVQAATVAIEFGWKITLYYLLAAFIGALLLETVNYVEHYGLR